MQAKPMIAFWCKFQAKNLLDLLPSPLGLT
uniref:Uncharacterized protein n=1 Tax=Rhizophora mucronata TaxID=61149 RepID=A0A2P2NX78_RHIMU